MMPPTLVEEKPSNVWLRLVMMLVVVAAVGAGVAWLHPFGLWVPVSPSHQLNAKQAGVRPPNQCATNTLSSFILVSVSRRHLWACDGPRQLYDSPVITGMENIPADLTPRGTYHIVNKATDLYLAGSDSAGSWHDFVHYWMPFLWNQDGGYGFHDATWRSDSEFGNVDPNSSQASHGCVELPLASAKWLYDWANIGTTVTVQS